MKTSIIMTSYNYESFIAQAIESVIAQTVQEWELIIIDDGSKDKSLEIINDYCLKDERIKLFTHPNNKNRGLKNSILLGIQNAKYDWIAFLESDDYWEHNYLEEKLKFIEKYPDCGLIYNNVNCFGNEKIIQNTTTYFEDLCYLWKNTEIKDVFDEFGQRNIVPTFSCVMCKKEAVLNINFETPCNPVLDYWVWWQIAEKYQFGFINKKLTNWRFHQTSYFSTSAKRLQHYMQRCLFINNITKIFKRQPKLSSQNKLEKILILSFCIYFLIYAKRKLPQFIKNLFITR